MSAQLCDCPISQAPLTAQRGRTFHAQWAINSVAIATSLSVALVMPHASEKIFAVTGASSVCFVCYCLPAIFHIKVGRVVRKKRACSDPERPLEHPLVWSETPEVPAQDEEDELLMPRASSRSDLWYPAQQEPWKAWLSDVAVPVGMATLGVGFSAAALWIAVLELLGD